MDCSLVKKFKKMNGNMVLKGEYLQVANHSLKFVATMSLHLQIFILLNECMLNSNFYFLKVDEVNKTANN